MGQRSKANPKRDQNSLNHNLKAAAEPRGTGGGGGVKPAAHLTQSTPSQPKSAQSQPYTRPTAAFASPKSTPNHPKTHPHEDLSQPKPRTQTSPQQLPSATKLEPIGGPRVRPNQANQTGPRVGFGQVSTAMLPSPPCGLRIRPKACLMTLTTFQPMNSRNHTAVGQT